MKLNLGCGQNHVAGYLNVDKAGDDLPHADTDFRFFDLDTRPWPWADSSVSEILFNHSLEHMGGTSDIFLGIMVELYRVCEPNALIRINVPHPRHDDFTNDPTHVRIITPDILSLFSRANCDQWKRAGNTNTPLAIYLGVDFELVSVDFTPDPRFSAWVLRHPKGWSGTPAGQTDVEWAMVSLNNCLSEIKMVLKVIK